MAETLKPCPFCGGDKLHIVVTDYVPDDCKSYAVSCRTVDCHGVTFQLGHGLFKTEDDAIEAWNRRAAPAQAERAVCPVCKGNDADMPCAYPSENQKGCLRDKRLSRPAPAQAEQAVALPANCTQDERGIRTVGPDGGLRDRMPNPSDDDLVDPLFEAIWQVTKSWDVNVPQYYAGYCGLNGSHVMLILNAIRATHPAAALSEDGVDMEAVGWAYKKLLAFGVGNTNMESAMMLDRLREALAKERK